MLAGALSSSAPALEAGGLGLSEQAGVFTNTSPPGKGTRDDSVSGIPYKPDPSPAVDGRLEEWSTVPGALSLNRREQATYGGERWGSPEDLSAKVWLAWREDMLYLAADVTDDHLRQTHRGQDLWRGDHLELFLDLMPEDGTARDSFGQGQFHFGFSPGNFQETGDPVADCPPETYSFQPHALGVQDVRVAAQPSDHGWTLEAGIPWRLLGAQAPKAGMPLNFEVAVSDTDGLEARQEKMMTFSTNKWVANSRSRLNIASLAGSDGKALPLTRGTAIFETLSLKQGEKRELKFSAVKPPSSKEAVLSLKARMDFPTAGGYTPALKLALNGTPLDGKRLMNKPHQAKGIDGKVHSLVAGEQLTTFYAPDYTSADQSQYAMRGVKTCEFELRITDLLREGENELVIQNSCVPAVSTPLVVTAGKLVFGAPPPPPQPKAGAPKGPLTVYQPAKRLQTEYHLRELPDAKLELEIGGEKFLIESRFSTPASAWERGSNKLFHHARQIERGAEAIIVCDTFKNLTSENLPLMQRHEVALGKMLKAVWLSGISPATLGGATSQPQNPTTFAVTTKTGLGLLPLNDEFQVHTANYAGDGMIGLADNQFVLQPGATYTAEWAIVPTEQPEYFDFVNATRRLLDANFTISYCFAFLRAAPQTEAWSDEAFANFIKFKNANLVCATIDDYEHGIVFQRIKHDHYKRWVERVRRLVPGVKTCVYFHCFINCEENGDKKFADSRLLRSDGTQGDYGEPVWKLFNPTATNSYGPAVAHTPDIIMNEIGADGVYWDELECSAYQYHYGEPWDGCSADIDPRTMKITRLKSSVSLITQPWRIALVKEIMARGPFIANGQPYTRTMARLKFPRFVETGSISHCAQAQLHSPIALGDHLTERSEEDAYQVMLAALDYGCVYHWYNDLNVIPTHETLTRYMYPITPLELHEGYIIGKERILTKRSGLFGWEDRSGHEAHVFNEEGREVPGFAAPLLVRGGNTFTELRIGEGWSAVIVRK